MWDGKIAKQFNTKKLVKTTTRSDPAYTYVGCYRDDARRNLNFGPKRYGYTHATCQKACAKYKFFALQHNGWCCCGNAYGGRSYPKVADKECNTYGLLKGGAWSNAVFKNNRHSSVATTKADMTTEGMPAWTSVGCYRDDAKRNLNFGPRKYGYNQNTCRTACAKY